MNLFPLVAILSGFLISGFASAGIYLPDGDFKATRTSKYTSSVWATHTISCSVLDPIKGRRTENISTYDANGVFNVSPSEPEISNGLIGWSVHGSTPNGGFGTSYSNSVQFRFYDLEEGAWKSYQLTTGLQDSHDWYSYVIYFKIQDGMAYVLEASLGKGVVGTYSTYRAHGVVYDSKLKKWVDTHFMTWQSNSSVSSQGPSVSAASISEGTISWNNGFVGYRGGKWEKGQKGLPDAYFISSKLSGLAPLATTIYDLSTGGKQWSLKKDVSQAPAVGRNFSLQYSTAGVYTLTQTVVNSAGSSTFSRVVRVAAVAGTYGDWLLDYPALTPATWKKTDDPDGDGLTNIQEALFKTSPVSSQMSSQDSSGMPAVGADPDGKLRVSFKINSKFDADIASGLVKVRPQSSSDFTTWKDQTATLSKNGEIWSFALPAGATQYGRVGVE